MKGGWNGISAGSEKPSSSWPIQRAGRARREPDHPSHLPIAAPPLAGLLSIAELALARSSLCGIAPAHPENPPLAVVSPREAPQSGGEAARPVVLFPAGPRRRSS